MLVRDRSARVNQLVSRISIAGKMKLSATPSRSSIERKQPEVANDAGKRREDAPGDECNKNEDARAASSSVGYAGDLEEKVSEEEESAKQCRAGAADMEGLGESSRSAEAVIRCDPCRRGYR